ncbi:TRAP transporter small permease [Shimia sp. R9_3]|uniref:TRAP transporter small permease n=1 Tax=Shimia sp. R9_3 TaxID=2821113 RepID=UPI001ADC1BEE|nr:TRAP transporter small permease [Shimia sp. R9_3]MBO9402457.1 TRAP transporter small permease [Shimia sp. R9_3]
MYKWVERLARLMAVAGGVVLTLLVGLTCLSVLGRGLNTLGHSDLLRGLLEKVAAGLISSGVGPINGDFELVEAGVAFAIFSFLPICQLYKAHATVDIFTNALPRRANRILTAFWELVLSAVILLITWRLFVGMQNKLSYGETTFILQFPIWWAYGLSFIAACVASIVSIYCAAMRLVEMLVGRDHLLGSEESGQ